MPKRISKTKHKYTREILRTLLLLDATHCSAQLPLKWVVNQIYSHFNNDQTHVQHSKYFHIFSHNPDMPIINSWLQHKSLKCSSVHTQSSHFQQYCLPQREPITKRMAPLATIIFTGVFSF